ncbi:hypothetical protein [Paraferrimonas sedimenticola]|uniref:Uncharacterized protein n=1 Tax=Paraferrimonas sedimenticola TaxID=375674 RepID=A0AA37RT75_9GAMM|nr:hypothetical protein [Paraferrimonas sedimenticola]GLP95445.1 hypothetical protein GCM10007895_07510 [Paraferrimonas sedimenticola]
MLRNICLSILSLLSFSAYSAGLTDTYSCDTCDYNDAVNIAKQEYTPISCTMQNTNGGQPIFGVTTYACNTTYRTIIVANPLTETAHKFKVTATNYNPYTDAVNATTSNLSLTSVEQQALSEFYDIDADFRDEVPNFVIGTSNVTNPDVTYSTANVTSNCEDHPSHYFTSENAKRNIRAELIDSLVQRLGSQSWNQFYTDTKINGFGVDISGSGGGITLNWQYNQLEAFITKSYGNTSNKLVFKAVYKGESTIGGVRDLNIALRLEEGASLMDGIPVATLRGPTVDLTTTLVSACLIENIEKIAISDTVILPFLTEVKSRS